MKTQLLFTKALLLGALLFSATVFSQDKGGKIVGGYDVNINIHPHQVRLSMGCGGSILSPTWILTANHCTEGAAAASITVRAGISRLNQPGGQTVRVKRIVSLVSTNNGDMTLLELQSPLRSFRTKC